MHTLSREEALRGFRKTLHGAPFLHRPTQFLPGLAPICPHLEAMKCVLGIALSSGTGADAAGGMEKHKPANGTHVSDSLIACASFRTYSLRGNGRYLPMNI